jgi:hypothetical protein
MADLPDGYVDPQDLPRVTAIVAAVQASTGAAGVFQLLARLPGVRFEPGTEKRFLHAAVPPAAWLGAENKLVLDGPTVVQHHVVGGVTLQRAVLRPSDLPAAVARLIAYVVANEVVDPGARADASAALTAHQELFGPF